MKAIGLTAGQAGDAIIAQGAISSFKKLYPESHFTFALAKKFAHILPLFEGQKNIDAIHTWEGYDELWPTPNDIEFIKKENFDLVFNGMARHKDELWYLKRHQVEEVCHMFDLPPPVTNKIDLVQNFERFKAFEGWVGLTLFPNFGVGPKSLDVYKANQIAAFLTSKYEDVVQLGHESEQRIGPANIRLNGEFMDAVAALASCKLIVTGDTCFSWIASALNIPVVGLYATSYYPYAENSLNWQPVNPNAIYLEGRTVNDIPMEKILEAIESKL